PHPAVLFFLLIAAVVVLSHVLQLAGVGAAYQRINLETPKPEEVRTTVRSLLAPDGVRFIVTSGRPVLINFRPVGTSVVAMIGVGLAEQFVISQFVAYFSCSNIGTIVAVHLANPLKDANLGSVPLLLAFILIGFVPCFPLPNILPKWAIMAPIFVPLFLK